MKKLFFLFAILLLASAAFSQTDFSGTWTLNRSKSTLNDEWSMAPNKLIIEQASNELKVEKQSTFRGNDFTINDTFTLDGKESINKGWRDTEKKSTAAWEEGKKALKINSKLPMRDNGEMTITELYQLDNDNLVIETSVSSSFGDRTEKYVFDKE